MEKIVENVEDLGKVAREFAQTLNEGDVVLLTGDLGAGKTTFVKAVAKALGFDGLVTSPTFTILNEYAGKMPIYHFDMYRLKSCAEAVESGLDEVLRSGEGVCFVEWPQKVAGILPKNSIMIDISVIDENARKIRISEAK
ncbi:MAG: tRNA (adenosine(37)-N6)-threonylcarbamoyltransferase complex ATPase subunit type 1 TsaE [Clostridia bacterium]|nr:tRNA (adenosine(37)-N6)-threonylcarbamoyltransferase complex ATPase subunit type 1 TsaE [Clostridia bacterium]